MRLLTAAEQRELDRLAAEQAELPTRALMESAGAAVAAAARAMNPRRVFVFCGPGNNGGDGYGCARFLRESGMETICIATRGLEELKGDARAAAAAWVASGGKNADLRAPHLAERVGLPDAVLVDAVFGSGLSRAPAGSEAFAIEVMNEAPRRGARLGAGGNPRRG